jgi:hypothetical protein
MPAKTKAPQDGHEKLVQDASKALRDAGRWPEQNVLRMLPEDMLRDIAAYWGGRA